MTVSTGARLLDAATTRLRQQGVLSLELGRPTGPGWSTLPAMVDGLQHWHAEAAALLGDDRAAAFTVGGLLVATPVLVLGLPAVVGQVEVAADLDDLALRAQGVAVDGWAVAPSHLEPLTDEYGGVATTIGELTTPLVAAATAALPLGAPAAWGLVGDAIGAYALWFARESGDDASTIWRRVDLLLDRLAAQVPVRRRPRLFPVVWSGGTTHYPVRATCCLYYRTNWPGDATGNRYCTTCPLRSDDERARRLIAHLEAHG